ncbi:MAG: hypothetical protein NVSMB57_06950 [Actinomycetota bacterium]
MKRFLQVGMVAGMVAMSSFAPAQAFHLYRSTDGHCSPKDGPTGVKAAATTTVAVQHNTFLDGTSNTPVTHIKAGNTVKWTWNSLHCHSVQFDAGTPGSTYSGFHYPISVPKDFVRAVPGFFEYPQLSSSPTLSWSATFKVPGVYHYICEHHYDIGMHGIVIVDA